MLRKKNNSIEYWLSRPASERLAEVTRLVRLSLEPGQVLDRTKVEKLPMHEAKSLQASQEKLPKKKK